MFLEGAKFSLGAHLKADNLLDTLWWKQEQKYSPEQRLFQPSPVGKTVRRPKEALEF